MTLATFCFFSEPGCDHPRCRSVRVGTWRCDRGHPLRVDGFCMRCDSAPIPFLVMLNALQAAGCEPRPCDEGTIQ